MTWDDMVRVGEVARPHGLRGEVVVNPATDFVGERFRPGRELTVNRGGRAERVTIRRSWMHQGRPVLALEGIDSRTDAEALAGAELRVPLDEVMPPPAGAYYVYRLVDCEVWTRAGQSVGRVVDVAGLGLAPRLVVKGTDGEIEVPLAEAICVEIDVDRRRIVVDPPEGLLDLNR